MLFRRAYNHTQTASLSFAFFASLCTVLIDFSDDLVLRLLGGVYLYAHTGLISRCLSFLETESESLNPLILGVNVE